MSQRATELPHHGGARLLIVGPPGAGKGTQAARLSALFEIPAIATGDIFRYNIKNGTPLGIKVKSIVDAGDYVPDSLTNELDPHQARGAGCARGLPPRRVPAHDRAGRLPRRDPRELGTRAWMP